MTTAEPAPVFHELEEGGSPTEEKKRAPSDAGYAFTVELPKGAIWYWATFLVYLVFLVVAVVGISLLHQSCADLTDAQGLSDDNCEVRHEGARGTLHRPHVPPGPVPPPRRPCPRHAAPPPRRPASRHPQIAFRNQWFRQFFVFALVMLFYCVTMAFGAFALEGWRFASGAMVAIAALLLTESCQFFSVNNVGSDAHTAFAGCIGQALAVYAMVMNVSLWPVLRAPGLRGAIPERMPGHVPQQQ